MINASIDALGWWLSQVDQYLQAIEKIEPKLEIAEQAYGTNLEAAIKAVLLIPGSGEFTYDTVVVNAVDETEVGTDYFVRNAMRANGGGPPVGGSSSPVEGTADVVFALEQLQERYPKLECVSLVVSWFGTDLRAGNCVLNPGVDDYRIAFLPPNDNLFVDPLPTIPYEWSVAGRNRSTAHHISKEIITFDFIGPSNFGGTPSDQSVVRAIQELRRRNLKVTFYPFILMDIPPGNGLPDPYGGSEQGRFPWRGRITCFPAPGQPGTVDRTAVARTQIEAFVAQYRPFILHQANLCAQAGGVDAFCIGTEMRGATWVRDEQDRHPFVDALVQLAADVKALLPGAKITYASDWSEFTPYQTPDGNLVFHLDPLWTSPSIDAIGIDNYWPLSDWRGVVGIDEELYPNIYDPTYLATNIQGGEGFDFFYASDQDRIDQVRTPITDGLGKPWVFRFKDIRSWWLNQHYNRFGGAEVASPTPWVPQSKPFWFTELGCPAIDKGTNQPNVFVDPKSSESFFPYFSFGTRDDLIQRRYIAAFVTWYASLAQNPTSAVYNGPMVDTSRIYIYNWDARPFPEFPTLTNVWGDGPNWERGHWITGRPINFPPPELPPDIGTEVDLMPARPMPKGEPAVDPKTGWLNPSMHHYLSQIELIARRLQNLRIIAVREEQRE